MDARTESWFQAARDRLASAGFVISDEVSFENTTFRLVSRQTRIELTKFGFSESFFIFGEFDHLTKEVLRRFSADAFRYAKQQRLVPLPCGIFESVWCYAVAITDSVDEATETSVRVETPTRHWALAEIPVVYDQAQARLFYFEKTPIWGYAYYQGFRNKILRLLG